MKIILEFDGDTERDQAQDAINVHKMRMAMQDFHEFLRRHYKHGNSDDPKTQIAYEFNTEFLACLHKHGIEDVY